MPPPGRSEGPGLGPQKTKTFAILTVTRPLRDRYATVTPASEGRRPRDRRKKRPAAEAGDVQVLYECAIGSEDEDGVQW